LLFNAIIFVSIAVIFLMFFKKSSVSCATLICGSIFGLLSVVFQVSYVGAMSKGPVSLTVLINNFSLLLPVIAGRLFYNETIKIYQIIAIIFLLLSFTLSLSRDKNGPKINKLWLCLSILCFFASGLLNIMQKIHQNLPVNSEYSGFVLTAYCCASVLSFAIYFARKKVCKESHTFKLNSKSIGTAVLIGAILGGFQFLMLYTIGIVPSVILFPMYNGLVTVFLSVIGVCFFKDKLTKMQWTGVVLGCISIILISVK